MPLQFQTKHIPVMNGMDEGVDELNLASGSLKSAKNVRFTKDMVAVKRPGTTLVSGTSDFTGGFGVSGVLAGEGKLLSDGNRLYLADGRALHAYTGAAAKKWSTKSLLPRFTGTSRAMGGSNKMVAHHAQCTGTDGANTYTVVGYTEHQADGVSWGGALIVRVFRSDTLAEVNTTNGMPNNTPANTFQLNLDTNYVHCIQLVPCGTSVVAIYAGGVNAKIYYRALDLTTMAWGVAETAFLTDNSSLGGVSSSFDAKPAGAAIALVYQTSGWLIKAQKYTVAGTVMTLANTVTVQDRSALPVQLAAGFGICVGSSHTLVSWGCDDNVSLTASCATLNSSTWALESTMASAVVYAGLREVNGDYVIGSCSVQDANDANSFYVGWTHICGWSGGNVGSDMALGHVHHGTIFHKVTMVAGVLTDGGQTAQFGRARVCSTPLYDSTSQRYFCVMERWSGYHLANAQLGIFGNGSYPTTPAANVGSKAANQATTFLGDIRNGVEDSVFFPRQSYITSDAGATQYYNYKLAIQYMDSTQRAFTVATVDQIYKRSSVNLVKLSTSDAYRYHAYDSEEGTYLSGGFPGYIDGRGFSPLGFCSDPGYLTVKAGGGAALSGVATVVFEYVDRDGNVQRSDIGTPVAFSSTVPIILRAGYPHSGWDYLQQTNRAAYSLPVGETMAVFYLGGTSENMREAYRTEVFPGQVTYSAAGVTLSSSALSALPSNSETAPFVYTYGGFLPVDCPPAFIGMCQFGGRLFGLDHTQRTLWFSKVLVRGERAQFSLDQTIDLPFDAEAIYAMDGSLYVFGRNSLGRIQGDGPNDNGDGGAFTDCVVLATDLGCSESRSIIKTPAGIMFKSPHGFQLLDRSGQVNFIGSAVIDLVDTYPTVRSAVQHPTDTIVLFACDNGTTGVRLVYNYLYGRWSYDTVNGGAIVQSQAAVGSTLYSLLSDGTVYREDTSTGLDNGSFVSMELVFASEKPAGVQAQHRFRCASVVGKRLGNCDVTLSVAFDDDAAYPYTQTFPQDSASDNVEAQFYPGRQLGRSIRIKFADAFPSNLAGAAYNNGVGVKVSGIGLEFGAYDNMHRVDSGKRK